MNAQAGGTLIGLLLVLLIGFGIWKLWPTLTSTAPPIKQVPVSLAVDGPTRLAAGDTAIFFVSLAYAQPLHADYSHRVNVEVLAEGFGSDPIDSKVEVGLRSGQRRGSASFALSCERESEGRFILSGGDGSSASDGTWYLVARVPEQTASHAYQAGGGMTVVCGEG